MASIRRFEMKHKRELIVQAQYGIVPSNGVLTHSWTDATERVHSVHKNEFVPFFGGPRSVVAVFG
jgi:hypothetical protein